MHKYICIGFSVHIILFTIIITSFDPHNNTIRERYIPFIFIDDETEAYRG